MVIIAGCLTPLCWFGSPADFWFVAVGALVSTVIGCVMVIVQEGLDVGREDHQDLEHLCLRVKQMIQGKICKHKQLTSPGNHLFQLMMKVVTTMSM